MTRSVAETNVTLAATVSPSRSETHWSSLRLTERLRSLGVLFLLSLILPFTLLVVLAAWVLSTPMRVLQSRRKASGGRKTILLSGGKMTKSLQLARAFHAAGHRVLLCETEKYACSGSRFSNAVDGFFTTPRPDESDYADKLKQIVVENDVDVYVPVCSPVASRYDAEAGEILADHCEVIHATSEAVSLLDDKYRFATKAHELGLGAPKSHLITTADRVAASGIETENRRFILKSIAYDPVRRLDLTKLPFASREATLKYVRQLPISESNPWILQEFIPGEEFCTHSTVRGGEVTAHCCCRSSEFQVNYEHIDDPEIEAWVKSYVGALKLTGQVSFDFIRASDDGRLYGIECNPRTHSAITAFYDSEQALSRAYLAGGGAVLTPSDKSRATYWLYHELWRLITSVGTPRKLVRGLQTIFNGKEAVFRWTDPLPFLMINHYQIGRLLLDDLRTGKGWVRIDFNIGKLVQAAGD